MKSVPPQDGFGALVALYAFWEAATARDRRHWPPLFRCPDRCSRCCGRSPAVSVTAAEAQLLAESILAAPAEKCARLSRRLRETAARLEATAAPLPESGTLGELAGTEASAFGPCPLLEDEHCALYEARPLLCRAYGFAAEEGNVYFGCEELLPILMAEKEIRLPSLTAALTERPEAKIADRAGRELPVLGSLAEMVVRLL